MSNSDLTPKTALPITHAVIVLAYRDGQPWPLLAVEFRADGHAALKGPQHAGSVVEHLIRATRLALRQIAETDLRTALLAPEPRHPLENPKPTQHLPAAGQIF